MRSSVGFLSRLERESLLGPAPDGSEPSEAELTLIRALRGADVSAEEALARILRD